MAAATPESAFASAEADRRAVLAQIEKHRRETWRWQGLMGRPLGHDRRSSGRMSSAPYRQFLLHVWRKRAARARSQARRPPHRAAWLCLHRHEGAWNDGGEPYFGGLQMDLAFQQTHGADLLARKGTAENWTPLEQMWVAERALRHGVGFSAWPSAAHSCDLL